MSTKGENEGEVPGELVSFLKFVGADLSEMDNDFSDAYVKRLQESVHRVKHDREMGERYMLFERLLEDERKAGWIEGKAESVIEILRTIGDIPEDLRHRINDEKNLDVLQSWLLLAAKAQSVEQFMKEAQIF